jgi:hypothetical protein
LQTLHSWLENYTTPSSKQDNVVSYVENGVSVSHQLHYRTVSLENLFESFLEAHPELPISSSYFYTKLPPWLCLKTQKSGLCIYHDKAIRLGKVLLCNRIQWHQNCTCNCFFCR